MTLPENDETAPASAPAPGGFVKKLALALFAALAAAGLAALGGYVWWSASIEDFGKTPFGADGEKVVEVPPGAHVKEVARLLLEKGVISDERRFDWLARRLKRDRQLKTGEYGFQGALTPEKVLEMLALGKVKLHHCTVPEGLRMDEIVPLLAGCEFGAAAEYGALVRDAAFARKLGVRAASLEGYLFPDTYSFPRNPKPEAVLAKMVGRFFEELKKAEAHRKKGVSLDAHQAATLASIVEKETGAAEERARISCVFHNRLRKNMKLETDPTVIYAKILRTGGFDGNIRREDLEFHHPYNTYTVKGLPPGPIANAGAAALQAALNPIDCDDLFFVACGGGTHKFCPDYECHKKFVDRCQLHKR